MLVMVPGFCFTCAYLTLYQRGGIMTELLRQVEGRFVVSGGYVSATRSLDMLFAVPGIRGITRMKWCTWRYAVR